MVGLSLIDVVVLSIWFFVDPQTRQLEIFQLENPIDTESDIKIRPSLEHCNSKHQNIWLGIIIITETYIVFNVASFKITWLL